MFFLIGPGTFYADACPDFSVFVLSAWLSFCFNILHIQLMLLAFDAYRRKSWPRGSFCVLFLFSDVLLVFGFFGQLAVMNL